MLSSEIYTSTSTTAMATAMAMASATATSTSTAATTATTEASTLHVLRGKKRRKRRKRAGHATGCHNSNQSCSNNNKKSVGTNHNNLSSNNNACSPHSKAIIGCMTESLSSGNRKCKAQYFQHDNREYISKYESFQFTAQATTAAALNYAAVAKKFKPLRPVLASGAKKNRRPALSRKEEKDCACVCQGPVGTQCPQKESRTADVCQRELSVIRANTTNSDACKKVNINGNGNDRALPALLELLKQSSSTWLQTLLLGAGSAAVASVRETHQIAEAQQQKNAKLREAFNISEYFVEGSSFDCDRKAKEDLAKSVALQKELDAQRESLAAVAAAAGKDKETGKRYALLRTPSREREGAPSGGKSVSGAANSGDEHVSKSDKKKKKKRARESSASPERRKDKKKKSKKHKKER